jgi:hypothetical protein
MLSCALPFIGIGLTIPDDFPAQPAAIIRDVTIASNAIFWMICFIFSLF